MTLGDMLNEIDFEYTIEDGKIRLIDTQEAYLGNIGEERWEATQESVPSIIDRLNIYWNDYIYTGIADPLVNSNGKELDNYEDNGDFAELLKYCEAHNIKDDLTKVLYYIVHPDEIILEEVEKKA